MKAGSPTPVSSTADDRSHRARRRHVRRGDPRGRDGGAHDVLLAAGVVVPVRPARSRGRLRESRRTTTSRSRARSTTCSRCSSSSAASSRSSCYTDDGACFESRPARGGRRDRADPRRPRDSRDRGHAGHQREAGARSSATSDKVDLVEVRRVIPVFEPVIGEEETQAVVDGRAPRRDLRLVRRESPAFERSLRRLRRRASTASPSPAGRRRSTWRCGARRRTGRRGARERRTNIATALAAFHNGAIAGPGRLRAETWNLDLDLVEALITPQTKAIIPVHLYRPSGRHGSRCARSPTARPGRRSRTAPSRTAPRSAAA